MTTGDANGDGQIDAVSARGLIIYVANGNGDGTFGAPQLLFTNSSARQVAVVDVNGDGVSDLVATCTAPPTNSTVTVFLGAGGGLFEDPQSFDSFNSSAMTTKDLDGDGWIDVIVAGNAIQVLLNQR